VTRAAAVARGIVFPLAVIVLLQLGAMAVHLQSDTLAAPAAALVAGAHAFADWSIPLATLQTLANAFGGLLLGGAFGLLGGILLGSVKTADRLMEFSVEALRPIPSVALIPVAMLVFGFGYRMEIAIVSFAAFWPVLILTRNAVAGVDRALYDVARVLQLDTYARIAKIVLPAALPRIFVAFRLSAGIALTVAVTVEVTTNPLGLGYGIMTAEQSLHPDLMLAYLAWIGVVGWALNAAIVTAQQRLFGRSAHVGVAPR
jgi:ABC-type nitrate/sulfonate/bicarbonate transport system permease component